MKNTERTEQNARPVCSKLSRNGSESTTGYNRCTRNPFFGQCLSPRSHMKPLDVSSRPFARFRPSFPPVRVSVDFHFHFEPIRPHFFCRPIRSPFASSFPRPPLFMYVHAHCVINSGTRPTAIHWKRTNSIFCPQMYSNL